MNSLHSDLLAIILARLPIKSITICNLVCKEWKSIVESEFLRKLFLSHHQNSHSSWSFICNEPNEEVLAHYGCENWGLSRSLGSYISSFLTDEFQNHKDHPENKLVRVVAYTDDGLILVCLHVPSGLVTKVENGVLLGYKVVVMNANYIRDVIELLIYSSDTGLWSFTTLHSSLLLRRIVWHNPVNLNGSLYWLGNKQCNPHIQVVVSHDFYAESDLCQVLHFPDIDNKSEFKRPCTTSQGFLMYMNVSLELKLSIWRLESGEWKLVAQISPKTAFDYITLTINPFDSNTAYVQRKMPHCLACANLHKGKFGDHSSDDSGILSFAGEWDNAVNGHYSAYATFSLPRWLYRIPSPLSCSNV
ncbi:PREDICTED: F-box protein At3g28330-like [Camelina sativa]|uniref:F-box protein At3g28330-like n=1 Tax=Camelina sativa TaxID=90675 RepID=A0ABM1RNW9_CAMSA|nr:PREDICTED: F-box protein At3g28330-like [Camelina sativa]